MVLSAQLGHFAKNVYILYFVVTSVCLFSKNCKCILIFYAFFAFKPSSFGLPVKCENRDRENIFAA